MKLLARIAQKIVRQLEPYLKHWELFDHPLWQISYFFLKPNALFDKRVNLFLIILNIVNGEYFALCVAAKEPQVFVSFGGQMLIDLVHDGGSLALLRKKDVAFYFLDDLD